MKSIRKYSERRSRMLSVKRSIKRRSRRSVNNKRRSNRRNVKRSIKRSMNSKRRSKRRSAKRSKRSINSKRRRSKMYDGGQKRKLESESSSSSSKKVKKEESPTDYFKEIPQPIMGKILNFLKGDELLNLHVTSKDKDVLKLVESDVYLKQYHSYLYIFEDSFRNRINDVLTERGINSKLHLDLSESGMTTFPNLSMFDRLVDLNLDHNGGLLNPTNIELLPRSLQILKLNDTGLTTFPNLSEFGELVELDLRDSYIIITENIDNLLPRSLKKLGLTKFTIFPNLSMFDKLMELELDGNDTRSFDENMASLLPPNLQKLYLDLGARSITVSNIIRIPNLTITKFDELVELSLRWDMMGVDDDDLSFGENIGLLPPNLKILHLNGVLTTFPNLSRFGKLVDLDFYPDSFIDIPENLGELLPAGLKKLTKTKTFEDRYSCSMTVFPDLSMLAELVELDLGNNSENIIETPENIESLLPKGLKKLSLICLNTTTVPNLKMFEQLVELGLELNSGGDPAHITPPSKIFELLPPNLQKLSLHHSTITTYPDLSMLDKLDELDLTYNRVMNNKEVERLLPRALKKLKLHHNREIKTFPDLSILSELIELDLEHNKNMIIDENVAMRLPRSLQKLKLGWCNLGAYPDLSMLRNLEELDFDYRFASLEHTGKLLPTSLKKLNSGKVDITKYPNLSMLTNLVELNLECDGYILPENIRELLPTSLHKLNDKIIHLI